MEEGGEGVRVGEMRATMLDERRKEGIGQRGEGERGCVWVKGQQRWRKGERRG